MCMFVVLWCSYLWCMGCYVLVVLVFIVSEDCSLLWVCGVVALVFVVHVVSRDYHCPWW